MTASGSASAHVGLPTPGWGSGAARGVGRIVDRLAIGAGSATAPPLLRDPRFALHSDRVARMTSATAPPLLRDPRFALHSDRVARMTSATAPPLLRDPRFALHSDRVARTTGATARARRRVA